MTYLGSDVLVCHGCGYRPYPAGHDPVDFVDQHKTMIDGHARYSGVCPNCGLRGAFCEAPR